MLDISKLKMGERVALEQLLSAHQLCFNDVNEQGVHLFGVRFKNNLVGYFGYELFENLALFRSMIVLPDVRNKGYGALIWHQAKEKLHDEGVKEVYLLTNTAAPFFSKQGFVEIVRTSAPESILATTEFKEFCPADSVCMKINLS
jgi:N-acetylglutamate synthase-like GNAT family acetyltransferase